MSLLSTYSTEGYCAAVVQAAQKVQPRFILGSASAMGRDLLPRVAARLGVGLAQDCIEIHIIEGQQLECVRPIFAGKAYAKVRLLDEPCNGNSSAECFFLGSAGRRSQCGNGRLSRPS